MAKSGEDEGELYQPLHLPAVASLPLVEPIGSQTARELVMQSMEVSLPRLRSRAENVCVCVRACVCVCMCA